MLVPPTVPQTAGRDRFLGRAAQTRRVYGVVGEEGLARLPSRRLRGREVSLFWSAREDAERLAETVAQNPIVRTYALSELYSGVLPGLVQHRRLVGLDWSGQQIEVELDPQDFGERLRLASLDVFMGAMKQTGSIYTLEGAAGPALLVSQTRPDVLVLPCWADADEAQVRVEGPWRDMLVIQTAIGPFKDERLAWLKRFGHLVGPDHQGGPGSLELQPEDLAARLSSLAP